MQLSMMLVIVGHHETLPDRRHRLYRRLFDHLLARREKAEPGVEWRPDDEKERQKAVAAMAFAMQDQRKTRGESGIVYTSPDLARLLPASVPHKERFLRWLVNQSGLLRDRADGKLQFARLSYQDFVAARHLSFEMSPGAEIQARGKQRHWWESLRLWAGLAHDEQARSLDAILPDLPLSLQGGDLRGWRWFGGAVWSVGGRVRRRMRQESSARARDLRGGVARLSSGGPAWRPAG